MLTRARHPINLREAGKRTYGFVRKEAMPEAILYNFGLSPISGSERDSANHQIAVVSAINSAERCENEEVFTLFAPCHFSVFLWGNLSICMVHCSASS